MRLNLYSVDDNYIKYLRQFDEKIYDNKEDNRTFERKYLGVVLTVNGFNYYIPMSSPKKSDYTDYENKIIRNDTKTIIRIHENGMKQIVNDWNGTKTPWSALIISGIGVNDVMLLATIYLKKKIFTDNLMETLRKE